MKFKPKYKGPKPINKMAEKFALEIMWTACNMKEDGKLTGDYVRLALAVEIANKIVKKIS